VTADESRKLNKGTRVCWRDDAADCGVITETSWDALTIAWDNGQVASVHHGDVREIHLNFDKTKSRVIRRHRLTICLSFPAILQCSRCR
jgi:hypothetical protein